MGGYIQRYVQKVACRAVWCSPALAAQLPGSTTPPYLNADDRRRSEGS